MIWGYMLRDGEYFIKPNGHFVYGTVLGCLGFLSREEEEVLNFRYNNFSGVSHRRNWLKSRMKDEKMAIWLKVLDSMLQYIPQKRITIKQLLEHPLFDSYLKAQTKPSEMQRIQIFIPTDLPAKATSYDVRMYVDSLLGMRKAVVDEWRVGMAVFLRQLLNTTPVPSEIWQNIFVLANVNRYM